MHSYGILYISSYIQLKVIYIKHKYCKPKGGFLLPKMLNIKLGGQTRVFKKTKETKESL